MTPDPTNEACERIARECEIEIQCALVNRTPLVMRDAILTAASRITALRVRETGAVEALLPFLFSPEPQGPDDVLIESYTKIGSIRCASRALAALLALEDGK